MTGQALSFPTQNGYIEVLPSNSTELRDRFSIAFDIKADSAEPAQMLLGREYSFFVAITSLYPQITLRTLRGDHYLASALPLPLGMTSRLTITYDQEQLSMYIDGVLTNREEVSGILDHGFYPLMIGDSIGQTFPGGPVFIGQMDNLAIYARALGEEEICPDLFDQLEARCPAVAPPPDAPAPGLTAYYDFEGGFGDTVHDRSGNGHFGINQGGAIVPVDWDVGPGVSGYFWPERSVLLASDTEALRLDSGYSVSFLFVKDSEEASVPLFTKDGAYGLSVEDHMLVLSAADESWSYRFPYFIADYQPYHLDMVLSEGFATLFVDGGFVERVLTESLTESDSWLTFGGGAFQGLFDEIKIYDQTSDYLDLCRENGYDAIDNYSLTCVYTDIVDDRDGDGHPDPFDVFPDDGNDWRDSDFDGVGDHRDPAPYDGQVWGDRDGDGADQFSDCDESDPLVFPGHEEICNDGVDQDCDGVDTACAVDWLTLSVEPRTIYSREPATLSWLAEGASGCSLSHGIGEVQPSGEAVVTPFATTTYLLSCLHNGMRTSAQATVTVRPNEDSLVVYYDFEGYDGGALVVDRSGQGNDGTVRVETVEPFTDDSGNTWAGFLTESSGEIPRLEVSHSGSFDYAQGFTMSFRAMDDPFGMNTWFLQIGSEASNVLRLYVKSDPARYTIDVYSFNPAAQPPTYSINFSTPRSELWDYPLTVVSLNTLLLIYVEDRLVKTMPLGSHVSAAPVPLYIGAQAVSDVTNTPVYLDEIRVFERGLWSEAICRLHGYELFNYQTKQCIGSDDPTALTDSDGDGHLDIDDFYPRDPSEWRDLDGDRLGDATDPDADDDGVEDSADVFPDDPNEWGDWDQDGVGDNGDPDDDNDGFLDAVDCLPYNPNQLLSGDYDDDDICNYLDLDDDNDGVLDLLDAFPLDPNEWGDFDHDGSGNNSDPDDDNDGFLDAVDCLPYNPNVTG